MGRIGEAVAELDSVDFSALTTEQLADSLATRAHALVCARDFERAESVLMDARVHAISSGSAAREADVEYIGAVLFTMTGRLDDAREAVSRVFEISESPALWSRGESVAPLYRLEETRSRAHDLAGRLAAFENRFHEHATCIRMAFAEVDRLADPDQYIIATLLLNLAILVRDLDMPEDAAFVRERLASVTFATSMKYLEFSIRHTLGWANAFAGDHVNALREYRKASVVAPSVALRMLAILDRAALARELSETAFASDEFDHAMQLSEQVDWSSAQADEVVSLLHLAMNLAPIDVRQARSSLEVYFSNKKNRSVMWQTDDLRTVAFEQYARAVILRHEGDVRRATLAFLESFEAYRSVSHVRRAAIVAADLYELTGEASYLAYAGSEAARTPHSHLARRVAALSARSAGPVASAVAQ